MKEAAIAGAAVAAVPTMTTRTAKADDAASDQRCPYFDQPMTCDGPDVSGKFVCDE